MNNKYKELRLEYRLEQELKQLKPYERFKVITELYDTLYNHIFRNEEPRKHFKELVKVWIPLSDYLLDQQKRLIYRNGNHE